MGRRTSHGKAAETWGRIALLLKVMAPKRDLTEAEVLRDIIAHECPAGTLRLVLDVVERASKQGVMFDD